MCVWPSLSGIDHFPSGIANSLRVWHYAFLTCSPSFQYLRGIPQLFLVQPLVRLNTNPGYPRLITGRSVGKPAGMETRGSESLVITGLHGSECVFWVLRVPATGTCQTIVFLYFILCG